MHPHVVYGQILVYLFRLNPGTLLSTFKTWYRGTCIYSVLEDNPVLHCHTLLERKEGALITKLTTARCRSWNKAQQRNQNRHKQTDSLCEFFKVDLDTIRTGCVGVLCLAWRGERRKSRLNPKTSCLKMCFCAVSMVTVLTFISLSTVCQQAVSLFLTWRCAVRPGWFLSCSSFSANVSSLTERYLFTLKVLKLIVS